jgi:hypothetical protein
MTGERHVQDSRSVLFVCESYYLRFYAPLADRLAQSGFTPIWVVVDGPAPWGYGRLEPGSTVEALVRDATFACRDEIDAVCVFERAVFERPALFKHPYRYTTNVVRTPERARRLAEAWYQTTLGLLQRFVPSAVFVWNGRYLPYSAVSAACAAAGQLLLTSEIGWIPGTIFVDRGTLSPDTTDLLGRSFDATAGGEDAARADAFLRDYTTTKATMVSQNIVSPAEVRQRLLASDGSLLLLYGCQVDWDTNVVIGARRFPSNEAAISFLLDGISRIPGARIVVKTHPLDSDKNEEGLRRLVRDRGTVVSDVHPHTLIEAADCVAVRNSTLGFEALCYGKPLVLLEHAKYRHPRVTLEAGSGEEVLSHLQIIAAGRCAVPDRDSLRQFLLHLLDHYLLPVPYAYYFEPAKLELLSHFDRNQAHQALEQVLRQAVPPRLGDVDPRVSAAVEACALRYPRQPSFLHRYLRRLSNWTS